MKDQLRVYDTNKSSESSGKLLKYSTGLIPGFISARFKINLYKSDDDLNHHHSNFKNLDCQKDNVGIVCL